MTYLEGKLDGTHLKAGVELEVVGENANRRRVKRLGALGEDRKERQNQPNLKLKRVYV